VLLLGSGGREHALAWKLGQSPLCETLYCAPGNPGIADETKTQLVLDLSVSDHSSVVAFCKGNDVGLVCVGPEAPLVDGLIDSLTDAGVPAFGPTKSAAMLEGSKVFMKVQDLPVALCHFCSPMPHYEFT
jgi:phosphoribosylamine---glycine ligase